MDSKPILMCLLLLFETSVEKTCKVLLLPVGKTHDPTFENFMQGKVVQV